MANKKTVSESDTQSSTADNKNIDKAISSASPAKPRYEGITNFAYVGPSLPSGRLKSNTVLSGTYSEIMEYYKDSIAIYPNVARLIVPVTQLAEVREKTERSGNLMNKYYTEINAAINLKGEER